MSSYSGMFARVESGGGRRRRWTLLVSLGLHVAAIAVLLHHAEPKFLMGAASLRGSGGRGAALTTIYLPGESVAASAKASANAERTASAKEMEEARRERNVFPKLAKRATPPVVESKLQPPATERPTEPRATEPLTAEAHTTGPPTTEQALRPGMPGYILGSLSNGFVNEHDVHIALPVVAPNPPIARATLPEWIRGDVIVEVTIDERGNVVQTQVLQTVGYGLEVVVVDTLRQWRFSPAKVDGVAVASRQDVHFHFPS
jgi:TonB family protein